MADRSPPIPDTVEVGPLVYALITDELELRRREAGAEPLRGECSTDRLRIVLDVELPIARIRQVVLHELLHAVYESTGLGAELGDKAEEAQIARLTNPLLDLLRRNPTLVAYLTAP